MLERGSSLHTATAAPARPRTQPGGGTAVLPRRSLAAAALLSVVLGYAFSQVLTVRHASLTAAVRLRPSPAQRGLSSLPPSAQGPVSAALGADDAAYHIRTSRGAFEAANPAQRLQERFDPAGV